MFFRWLNSAEMALINFWAHSLQIALVRPKIRKKSAFFSKSHKNGVIRVFWHVEFMFALKTELNPTVFEKNAKNEKKIYNYHYFLFFCDFL